MSALQPVRGTRDILPEEMRRHRVVIETARAVAARYGYEEMATPLFEFTEVFSRTLGETSDIVTKEMYTFAMKDGEQLTLRPEATAGIMRALISGGLSQQLPLKFFFAGPMFRYERPQKGRQRQFHQIDIELLGVAEPLGDVEVIAVGARILEALGVGAKATLELNSLGDPDSRAAYRGVLVDYFSDHRDRLSDDSRARLGRNPLRILDSKDRGDKELVAEAPVFSDYLNDYSRDYFAKVRAGLDELGIAYQINPRLVRGLDLGAQGAVLAGGRYDGLSESMGGPATPATGWAGGVERLAMLLADPPEPPRPIAVIPIGEACAAPALRLSEDLRRNGLQVDLGFAGNLSKRMKRANKLNARIAILLGEDELAAEVATLRDLDTGAQETVALDQLAEHLADRS